MKLCVSSNAMAEGQLRGAGKVSAIHRPAKACLALGLNVLLIGLYRGDSAKGPV